MLHLLRDIGAFAGIAAFLGLALLSLLYFSQARDLRRLRDWAGRAPERDLENAEATQASAAERAEQLRGEEERREKQEAVDTEKQATEKRQERRQRREMGLPEVTRTERVRERIGGVGGGRRMPEGRYLALVIGGVIVVGAVVAVLALSVFGGGGGGGKSSSNGVPTPSQTEVSVLNGTSVSGLATQVGTKVENKGYKLGAVTNSPSPSGTSVVMFKRGHAPEAKRVAKQLGINKARLMSNSIAQVAAGSDVAVVVGEDMASLGSSG